MSDDGTVRVRRVPLQERGVYKPSRTQHSTICPVAVVTGGPCDIGFSSADLSMVVWVCRQETRQSRTKLIVQSQPIGVNTS